MSYILRKNLISIINNNLYPNVINMKLIDFKNINLVNNNFIMRTIDNRFIIKSLNLQEIYKTSVKIDKSKKNINEKTINTCSSFVLKKLLMPNNDNNMLFNIDKTGYFVTIITNGEIPNNWMNELNDNYRLKLFCISYTPSIVSMKCEKILNNLSDEDIIKVDKQLMTIMNDKYFNYSSGKM
jgi:hypothetical protein